MTDLGLSSKLENIQGLMRNTNEQVVENVVLVDIDKIKRNVNNFYDEEYELEALAESIKENGLIQPLHITRKYEIISGHRRYNALQIAGIKQVKCIFVNDDVNYMVQLIEANRHRVKSEDEILSEVRYLEEYYKEQEKLGVKPKGRLRDLIAKDLGVSSATAQRKLNKVKEAVSTDNKEKKECSKEVSEFTKLNKQLNKIISLYDNGDIEMSEYVLENIYKLRDHINVDDFR